MRSAPIRSGFGLLPLLLGLLALAFGNSACAWNFGAYGWPSMLGSSTEPNIMLWPLDAAGTSFQGLACPADESIAPEDPTFRFDWPCDLSKVLPRTVGSVTVLLDPEPSVDLRARVSLVLSEVERAHPGVSTSVTVCAQALGAIDRGEDLLAAVGRLWNAKVLMQGKAGAKPILELSDMAWLLPGWIQFQQPVDKIVLPNAAVPGEYFVLADGRNWLSLPLPEGWAGTVQSQTEEQLKASLDRSDIVVLLIPQSAPQDVIEALVAMKSRLTPPPSPEWWGAVALAYWPTLYSELSDARAVRVSLQGRVVDCSCQYCQAGMRP